MRFRRRDIGERQLTPDEAREVAREAAAQAAKEATLTAQFSAHMAQCEKDKAETKAQTAANHLENTRKIDALQVKVDANMYEVLSKLDKQSKYIYIAIGIGLAVQLVLGHGIDLFGKVH